MIERKFETLLTQYGQAMQKLAVSDSADRERASAKAVRAKAILRSFLKDELEAARATAEQSRDSVIEECAKVCDKAEVAYNVAVRKETASFLALMIRALKSQQDAAIESKPAEQSADAKDAARYRWLRDSSDVPNGWAPMVFNCEAGGRLSWGNGLIGEELDAVLDPLVDAAIESQRSGDGS